MNRRKWFSLGMGGCLLFVMGIVSYEFNILHLSVPLPLERDVCGTLEFIYQQSVNDSFSIRPAFPHRPPKPKVLPWFAVPNRPSFDQLVKDLVTPDGILLFTTFDHDFHSWVSNWFTWVTWHGRYENALVIASLREECQPLWTAGLRCFAHEDLSRSQELLLPIDSRSKSMNMAIALKWFYSLRILQLGYQPLFSDADVVFLQDPFLLTRQTGTWDVLGLSDFCRPLQRPQLSHPPTGCFLYDRNEPCQSTGLMFFRVTKASLRFVQHVWDYMLETGQWEQAVANRLLVGHMRDHGLVHQLMDDRQAANCAIPKQLSFVVPFPILVKNWIALHAGYVHGSANKMIVFRDINLWMGEDQYRYRLQPPELENIRQLSDRIPRLMPVNWCELSDCNFCCPPGCIW